MPEKLTIAIAGATGVVGARALEHLLADERVERVVALGRRPLAGGHERLSSRVVDMGREEALREALPEGVDAAICALGTTMKKAGSKEAFRAVDRDAVLAFAAAAQGRGARRFLVVSSIGASARAPSFYLRTKGETEEALSRLGFDRLTILRPSIIDDQGARPEFRLGERLGLSIARPLFALAGRSRRFAPIPAETIGRALVRLAFEDGGEALRVVESDRLHALGG